MSKAQGPKTIWVARCNDFGVVHQHQRIGALHLLERLHDASQDILRPCLRHQVQDHLCIGGGAKDDAVRFQLSTQPLGIDEIAIVRNGQGASRIVRQQGLGIAQHRRPGGGIAIVPDGQVPGQTR